MRLSRIFVVIEFEQPERIQAFLTSEDVKKEKFGTVATPGPPQMAIHQLIQPDGFRITTLGRQIQVNYDLPNEVRELDDEPFDHLVGRLRRLVKLLANLSDGKAKWIGIQSFFEEVDKDAKNVDDAIANWAKRINSPVYAKMVPSAFNLLVGFQIEDLYEGVTIQPFEIRTSNIQVGPGQAVELPQLMDLQEKMSVAYAGMQFIVDVNTKPHKNPDKVDRLVAELIDRTRAKYTTIIDRGMTAVMGRPVDV